MSNEDKVTDLVSRIRHQYPLYITTFGECANKCGNSSRGAQLCPYCLESVLAGVVGPQKAGEFHAKTKEATAIIKEMLSIDN